MTILPLMILTSNSEVQRGVNAEPVFEYFPSEGHCGFLHISVIFTDKFDIKDPNKLQHYLRSAIRIITPQV